MFQIVVVLLICSVILRKVMPSWKSKAQKREPFILMNIPEDSRAAFIVCTFSMLAKLAQADGTISAPERAKVLNYIKTILKLDKKTEKLALRVFEEARQSPLELIDYAEQFRKSYPDRVQLHDRMISILIEVSTSDGVMSATEDRIIGNAALRLGLTEPGYQLLKERVEQPTVVH